eukprot:TRINITY_DN58239_c0_g1_i1.p1 TRINITY_DN58239_c0_g1~~TRINITY_DN58239_c0_g1_i1.p1  ORF type:complete len:289 (+),score=38.29 TRINITY_DN58239_c0_g1_i1:56-922(+)
MSKRPREEETGAPAEEDTDIVRLCELENCAGRYSDKVVIVTGAGRGIGEGCARVFFQAGSHVVIVERNEEAGAALAAELNARGKRNEAYFVRTDVTIVAELQALVDKVVTKFGRLDCLVNNAGKHPPHMPIDDFSVEDMQDLVQLNFVPVFALCKFALPHIRKVKGNIINISSLVGKFGQHHATTYAATKGAVTAFTKALAIDEAAHGVRVNSVAPGNIWTPMWAAVANASTDPRAVKKSGERVQVMGRMGTIFETGRLCLCIAADLTFTTGVDHIQSGGAEIGYGTK